MARPITLPPTWAALAEAMGGVSKLADALGVDRWTINRWARGDFKPHKLVQANVNKLARRKKVAEPFAGDP